jgi:excisionase family DNA binding protein
LVGSAYALDCAAGQIPAPTQTHIPDLDGRTMLRVEEVAKRWGLDRKTVYAMIERGQISARRCGRLVRIPRKVIESFELQASVVPERDIKCR